MKNKLLVKILFLSILSCLLINTAVVWADNDQDTLNQYISELQSNPDRADYNIILKTIKLAHEMKPTPTVSAEAIKYANRGEYAAKTAKTEDDYWNARYEYRQAALCAPWVAEYWFNQGVLAEKANVPYSALSDFEMYLEAAPNAKDASEVQKRIDGLRYAGEKAAKTPSSDAVVTQEQNNSEDWLKNLDKAKFAQYVDDYKFWFEIHGKHIMFYMSSHSPGLRNWTDPHIWGTAIIQGREFHMDVLSCKMAGTINEDGSAIVANTNYGNQGGVYPRDFREP